MTTTTAGMSTAGQSFCASRLCAIIVLTPGKNQSNANRPITPISSFSQVANGSMVLNSVLGLVAVLYLENNAERSDEK